LGLRDPRRSVLPDGWGLVRSRLRKIEALRSICPQEISNLRLASRGIVICCLEIREVRAVCPDRLIPWLISWIRRSSLVSLSHMIC